VTRGLKIIALTSGDQEKILASGFDGRLSKPISTRELPGLVKRCWRRNNYESTYGANPVRG
jgi:DNA-binding response OmpR family regulator